MTTTTITTNTSTKVPTTASTRSSLTHACPKCGTELAPTEAELASNAQTRIQELESQVKILTGKATAAGMISHLAYPPGPSRMMPGRLTYMRGQSTSSPTTRTNSANSDLAAPHQTNAGSARCQTRRRSPQRTRSLIRKRSLARRPPPVPPSAHPCSRCRIGSRRSCPRPPGGRRRRRIRRRYRPRRPRRRRRRTCRRR